MSFGCWIPFSNNFRLHIDQLNSSFSMSCKNMSSLYVMLSSFVTFFRDTTLGKQIKSRKLVIIFEFWPIKNKIKQRTCQFEEKKLISWEKFKCRKNEKSSFYSVKKNDNRSVYIFLYFIISETCLMILEKKHWVKLCQNLEG